MRKFKYVFLLTGLALLVPGAVLAAVSLNADTNLELSTTGITLVAKSGSTFDSLTVYPSYIELTLTGAQELTLTSSDKRSVQRSGGVSINQEEFTCGTSQSTYYIKTVATDPTQTMILTPTSYSCSGGASSGVVSSPAAAPGGGTTSPAPTPTVTPTPAPAAAPAKTAYEIQLENVYNESKAVIGGKSEVLANVGKTEDPATEQAAEAKYVAPLVSSAGVSVSSEGKTRMVSFVNYGTETTLRLGAGERAGVLYCFQDVYERLPESQDDWDDVLKIANGRWPKQTDAAKEAAAEKKFREIYLREPTRTNAHDDAAVVIITYGLKPVHRSLENEQAALKTFRHIYKKLPTTNLEWKIVRAIAESGAKR